MTLAVYPGSFDPPTVAHLGIVAAARAHVDEVRLVLSKVALGKEDQDGRTAVEDRLAVLRADGLDARCPPRPAWSSTSPPTPGPTPW